MPLPGWGSEFIASCELWESSGDKWGHHRRAWKGTKQHVLQIAFPQLSSGLTCGLTEASPPIPSLHFSHHCGSAWWKSLCWVEEDRVCTRPSGSLFWAGPLNSYLFNSHFLSFPTNLVFRILYRILTPTSTKKTIKHHLIYSTTYLERGMCQSCQGHFSCFFLGDVWV